MTELAEESIWLIGPMPLKLCNCEQTELRVFRYRLRQILGETLAGREERR